MVRRLNRPPEDESGFTLIEVLITVVVLGVIASGVGASIILFFRTADGTSRRLAFSHDSQLLANYLIPDLDSVTPNQPTVTPDGAASCPTGFTGVSGLQVKFGDVTSQNAYTIDYSVASGGTLMTRTVTRSVKSVTQSSTETTVIHNLKKDGACFSSLPGPPPWTIRVTLESNSDVTTDSSFSVTGGGRVTSLASPVGAPLLCPQPSGCGSSTMPSIVSQDTNADGRLNQIIVHFDRPLSLSDAAGASQWTLNLNLVVLPPVQVYGSTAVLTIGGVSGPAPIDTALTGLTIALSADPDGIRSASNLPASFAATPVTDGMAPVAKSVLSKDSTLDGRIDQVVVTFSENVVPPPGYSAGYAPWVLTAPPGSQWSSLKFDSTKPPTVSGSNSGNSGTVTDVMTLFVTGAPVDSAASGLQLALLTSSSGVRDTAANLSSFGFGPVADGMAPVATSIVSNDSNGDGRLDQIALTFSEPLAGYSAGYAPWTLTLPSGSQWSSLKFDSTKPPVVSGSAMNVVTLSLTGAPVDTAASGLKLALTTNSAGVQDSVPNLSSFAAKPVSDGMAPVATSVVSNDSTADGRLDQIALTFSEPLAGYSAGYAPWTLTLPSGSQWSSLKFDSTKPPVVSGSTMNVVTLSLTGAPVDTAASGLKLALATNSAGVQDSVPNFSSFAATAVTDGMGPVVIGLSSTGQTPGDVDPGNTITFIFSEPVVATPPSPMLMLTGGRASANTNDTLSIVGVASIDLGVRGAYIKSGSSATYETTVTTSGNVVKVVIGPNTAGGGNAMRADSPAPVTVTPSTSLTDNASPNPNPADGSFISGPTLLF